jgi:predicted dehydrogenase
VIRLGIVGSNFGRSVQLPAFRADPRCEVVALAGRDHARTAERASAVGVPKAHGDWRALVEDKDVEAVAIATVPALQAEIAVRALALGKPVFAEKPMSSTLEGAQAMLRQARRRRLPTIVDFNFHQIAAWQRAKTMLDAGAIGPLRHVTVDWQTENRSIQMRMRSWKTLSDDGGGVLGNFISHCFHYLEWFCGPLARLNARLAGLPGADYMRGFELWHAKRPASALARIAVEDPVDALFDDGRAAPVSRLAKLFLDAVENGEEAQPDFAAGYRVQELIDAGQRSHREGATIEVAPEPAYEGQA